MENHYKHLAQIYDEVHPFRQEVGLKVLNWYEKINQGYLLDIGCGTGALLSYLKEEGRIDSINLRGIDVTLEMIEQVQKRGIWAKQVSLTELNLPTHSVGVAVFQESIHHMNVDEVAGRLKKMLLPKGYILVFYQLDWYLTPNLNAFDPLIEYARKNRRGLAPILNILSSKGFEIIEKVVINSLDPYPKHNLELALQTNALSYWARLEDNQKNAIWQKCLPELSKTPRQLNRSLQLVILRNSKN